MNDDVFLPPMPPPPSVAAIVRMVSDSVNLRGAGGGGEYFAPDEPGFYPVQQPYQHNPREDDLESSADLDETRMLDVGEIVCQELDPGRGPQIKAKSVVSFVVLQYDPNRNPTWAVPDQNTFHDLLNRVENIMWDEKHECEAAFKWGNMWGKVGLVGLSPKNTRHINEYRELIEGQLLGDTRFTLFPKDALEKQGSISVLLRSNFRSLDPLVLPSRLLRRSRRLRGGLKVTHIKEYADSDRSRQGACKAGWRLILMQGDEEFMKSLEYYGQEHRFPVGSGHVIIRGGNNRPKGQDLGSPQLPLQGRGRGRGSAPQLQLQQHPQSRPGASRTLCYSVDFPARGHNDTSNREGSGPGTGRGMGAWSSPASRGRGASL